jgi:nucleoside-diphosphate-sugar epimerase
MMAGKILVTGGSGFIGAAVVDHLRPVLGIESLLLGGRAALSGAEATGLFLDLAAPEIVLPSGIDTVIHLAGEKTDRAQMNRVNFEAAQKLANAAADAGVKHFIHLSSVGVYGAGHRAGEVCEAAAHHPGNLYEQTKDAGESAVRESCRIRGLRCVILQPTNVIGLPRGTQRPLLSLMRAVSRGRYRHIGRGDGWVNYVAAEDVAAAIGFAAVSPAVSGTYIINTPTRLRHLISTIADSLGVGLPQAGIPSWAGALAGEVASWASTLLRRSLPFSRERFREMTNTTIYSNDAYRRAGFVYPVGIEAALTMLADAYRAEGLL